jgi:hypothetical protein
VSTEDPPKLTIEALRQIVREEIVKMDGATHPLEEWLVGFIKSLTNYWTIGVGIAIANWPAIEQFFTEVVLPSLSPEAKAWIAPILGIVYGAVGVALRQRTKESLRAKGVKTLKGSK